LHRTNIVLAKAAMDRFMNAVRSIDAYPKIEGEFLTRTRTGACVSIFSFFLIILLVITEVNTFFYPDRSHSLIVDSSRREKLNINFNISFPKLDCALVNVDAMDDGGDHQLKTSNTKIKKVRLEKDGSVHPEVSNVKMGGTLKTKEQIEKMEMKAAVKKDCGSCYGAGEVGECCNTCDDIRNAYKKKGWAFTASHHVKLCVQEGVQEGLKAGLGCMIHGNIELAKVGGNIHFAPSDALSHSQMPTHELVKFAMSGVDLSHTITSFSFGDEIPGAEYPLANVAKDMTETRKKHHLSDDQSGVYQYYIKVVPTEYTDWWGVSTLTNQYAVTTHFRTIDHLASNNVPGVFFYFELSAIRMEVKTDQSSIAHLLTSLMAIIGGVFAVLGLVDSTLDSLMNTGDR